MAEKPVLGIKPCSVRGQEPFHAVHQIGARHLDHEVEMVRHEGAPSR
jgi:hypothetical protein